MGRNNEKFSVSHIEFIKNYASELLERFNYKEFMVSELKDIPKNDLTWIEKYNASNLTASSYNLNDN